MKNIIKSILRERFEKNSLGFSISKPEQELIIMRGIPGSGKSTKAKSIVGGGIIHSTDDLIEATGDYNAFFNEMIKTGNFSMLSKMHAQNLKNAIDSMERGISPIVIDNTNIKPSEAKSYVVKALELGYSDNNIKILDVGTGGLSAEQLAKRNTHNVPLNKIEQMISSYNSIGPIKVEDIINSKDMYKPSDILYSAVVLDDTSKLKLLNYFSAIIPNDWKKIGHHMTISFGSGVDNKEDIGKMVSLKVVEIGVSDMAIAVKVEGYPSKNAIPHITLAINPNGGKPVMSNNIKDWEKINPIVVHGVVTEIKK